MEHSGTPSTSSLLKPLAATDILIRGEKVRYDERRHWAILIQPFLETLSVLVVITVLAGSGANNRLGLLIVIAAGAFMIYRLIQGDLSQALVYGLAGFLLLGFLATSAQTMALLAILLATIRFAYRAMMWLLYERLYITNRRVILAEGFLGSSISTMPLTRVTDINYTTTVPGELLGYASLRVETAGQDQALSWLQYLEKPAKFYATLIDLSTAAVGSVTEPDENDTAPIIAAEPPPPAPGTHIGTLDEDGGDGTRAP
jgi:hypothetical protein